MHKKFWNIDNIHGSKNTSISIQRKERGQSPSLKRFFKLMNNSLFGKTMENLHDRVNIKLIHSERKLKRYCAKPSFKRIQFFNENLVGVENAKAKLFLSKPLYVGQTILDLAKHIMYDF